MVHGVSERINNQQDTRLAIDSQKKEQIDLYYELVHKDYHELKELYPFCDLIIPPTVKPVIASIRAIAANKELIDLTGANKEDFLNMYSKELLIEIPLKYKTEGCLVYGAKWIDKKRIPQSQQHFYNLEPDKGYQLCVGVPESFAKMDNVILENVKTADHILTAYADFMTGRSDKIILKQYSHGDIGINEYKREKYKINKKGKKLQ